MLRFIRGLTLAAFFSRKRLSNESMSNMPIWSEPMATIKLVKGDQRPPSWGRWKVYINGGYRGSAGSKAAAQRLAKEMAAEIDARRGDGLECPVNNISGG